jgi:hypothetical protein
MKASTFFSIIGALAASVMASPASMEAALEQECGNLGVMKLETSQMEGVDPTNIRHCLEHPLGMKAPSFDLEDRGMTDVHARENEGDQSAELVDLSTRACYTGLSPGGCYQGYCWKKCDLAQLGYWCWTASNGGAGNWHTCTSDLECLITEACGAGNCGSCGCSC